MPNKTYSLRPLSDRVVVQRLKPETLSSGGIVIPDSASEKPNQGKVLAVGPGVRLDNGALAPMAVKIGDHILFSQYSNNEIKINGEEVLVLKEADILAVISNPVTVSKSPEKNP